MITEALQHERDKHLKKKERKKKLTLVIEALHRLASISSLSLISESYKLINDYHE